MTYVKIPGDCIDCVTAQNGDRVIFERLATPRPVPKVTLKRDWQSLLLVASGKHVTWENKAGVRDSSKRAVSKVDFGTHLSRQEVITHEFSINAANT